VLDEPARPKATYDRDGLLEEFSSFVSRGPALSSHVLVEVLFGTHTEEEPTRHHLGHGGGRLGHDRRMDPDQRACDSGANADPAGGTSDRSQHGPDERAIALLRRPWMDMVGDRRERETRLLRGTCEMHEVLGTLFLRGESEADLHCAPLLSPSPPRLFPCAASEQHHQSKVEEALAVGILTELLQLRKAEFVTASTVGFQSFENVQSEFVAVGSIVVLTIASSMDPPRRSGSRSLRRLFGHRSDGHASRHCGERIAHVLHGAPDLPEAVLPNPHRVRASAVGGSPPPDSQR
jgi:hypothetical protein